MQLYQTTAVDRPRLLDANSVFGFRPEIWIIESRTSVFKLYDHLQKHKHSAKLCVLKVDASALTVLIDANWRINCVGAKRIFATQPLKTISLNGVKVNDGQANCNEAANLPHWELSEWHLKPISS